MVALSVEQVTEAASADPEFRLCSKGWNGAFLLEFGDDVSWVLQAEEGRLSLISDKATYWDAWSFAVRAPVESWVEMLKPTPRPFYHHPLAAVMMEDFKIEGDFREYYTHQGAIARLVEIMRTLSTSSGGDDV